MRNRILSAAALIGAVMTFAAPLSAQAACQQFTASNNAHVTAGRAVSCGSYNMYACAKGSNENLGLNNVYTTTTLKEEPAGYFAKGTCPIATGSKPVVESWQLGSDFNDVTASNVIVTDADQDLVNVKLRVTNQRTGAIANLDCPVQSGTNAGEYVAASCGVYTPSTWGVLSVVPVAQDANGNVGLGIPETAYATVGSTKPVVNYVGHSWIGGVIKVTLTAYDLDNDITEVWLGTAAGGILCQGAGTYTCTWDWSHVPAGAELEFGVGAIDSVRNSADFKYFKTIMPEVSSSCVSDKNANHAAAGRATQKYINLFYANGSSDYLGMANDKTMLKQINAGTWKKVVSCN
jgi:hypothetical protein